MKQTIVVALLVLISALFATSVAAQDDDRITVTLNYNYNWDRVDLGVFAFDTPVYGTGVITINGVESEFSTTLQPDSNFGVHFAAPLKGTAKVVFKYRLEGQGTNNMELNRSVSWDDKPFVPPPPSPFGFPCFWACTV